MNCPPSAARSRSSPSSLRLADSSLSRCLPLALDCRPRFFRLFLSSLIVVLRLAGLLCNGSNAKSSHKCQKLSAVGGGSLRFAHSNKDKSNSTSQILPRVCNSKSRTSTTKHLTICSLRRSSSLCPDAVFSRSRVCIAIQQHGGLPSVHGLGCTLGLRYTHSNSSVEYGQGTPTQPYLALPKKLPQHYPTQRKLTAVLGILFITGYPLFTWF